MAVKSDKIIWALSLSRRADPLWIAPLLQGIVSGVGIGLNRRRTKALAVWSGIKADFYHDKNEVINEAKSLTKLIIKDSNYNQKYLNYALKCCNALINFSKKLIKIDDYKKLDNKEIIKLFTGINRLLFAAGTTIIRPRADAQLLVEQFLQKRLKSNSSKVAEYLNILHTPTYQSFIQKEEMIFIAFARRVKKGVLSQKVINQWLREHLEKYAWLPTDFGFGRPWTILSLRQKLKEYIRTNLKDRLEYLKSVSKNITEKKKQIFKELDMSNKMQRLCEIGAITGFVRLQRRYAISQVLFYGKEFMQEIQWRVGLRSQRDLGVCTYEEIMSSLLGNKAIKRLMLKERKEKLVGVFTKKKTVYYAGREAKKFLASQIFEEINNKTSELKGTVACAGKIRGAVKVILELSDMKKLKEGDILVSNETTPDLLPAMRKAGAFITDEGGLTSHAAIVSREMNKPCIIGTKIATKVLRDGQMVEVDANQGVVRVVEQ